MTKKNIDSPRERSASTLSPVEMSEMTDAFPTKSAPLRKLFPGYRERAAVEQEIKSNPLLRAEFLKWKEEKQQEFLDICCGNRGARILYDACFKYVFNPRPREGAPLPAHLGHAGTGSERRPRPSK